MIDPHAIISYPKFNQITEQLASLSLENTIPANESFSYKIILLGDCQTGKSSIIKRYTNNAFLDNPLVSTKTDIYNKSISIQGKSINITIWDSYCEERFKPIGQDYLRNMNIIIIVYDTSNRDSFENIGNWLEETKKVGNENTLIVIVEHDKKDKEMLRNLKEKNLLQGIT